MKKAIILLTIVLLFSFSACTSNSSVSPKPNIGYTSNTQTLGYDINEIIDAFENAVKAQDKTSLEKYWIPYNDEILNNAFNKGQELSLLCDLQCYTDNIPLGINTSSDKFHLSQVETMYCAKSNDNKDVFDSVCSDVQDVYNSKNQSITIEDVVLVKFKVKDDTQTNAFTIIIVKTNNGSYLLAIDGGEPSDSDNTISSSLNIRLDNNGFVNEYITDGVILLTNYSPTANHDNMCYVVDMSKVTDKSDLDVGFYFISKNADEIIPKIRKTETIGITNDYDEIDIIPIGSATPEYAVDFNFADVNYTFDHAMATPEFLFSRKNAVNFQLSECNGEDLTTFVYNHGDGFRAFDAMWNDYSRLFVTGTKNEEFTFGGYVGTTWREVIKKADIEYYKIYQKDKNDSVALTIPTKKTKNGYFIVDFSNLSPGLYYISTFKSFVELV